MPIFAIWIDREHAKIFDVSQDKMERKHFEAKHNDHHTHRIDEMDMEKRDRAFFGEMATHLSSAEKVLILGPGMAKHHFQTYLVEHQPQLAKKIVGCETVDHPSDGQISALAKKFFNTSFV